MLRRTLRSAILLNAATNRAPSGDARKSTISRGILLLLGGNPSAPSNRKDTGYFQHLANLLQPARADPIGTHFIFLDLLVRHPNSFANVILLIFRSVRHMRMRIPTCTSMGLISLAIIVVPPDLYAAIRFEITRRGVDVVAARAPGDLATNHRPIWIVGLTSVCGRGKAAGFVVRAVSVQRDHGFGFGRNAA